MWMIRGPRGRDADELLERGIIRLGWGNAALRPNDAEMPQNFYAAVRKCCPHLGHLQVLSASGWQISRALTLNLSSAMTALSILGHLRNVG